MKQSKLLPVLCILVAGTSMHLSAQVLPEITIVARNYKYLRSVDNKDIAQPVKLLEHKAAAYDIKNSDYYEDDYDSYYITFYLPQGYILATYDSSGKIIRTAERYKDIALPETVRNAVAERYPKWAISKDIYQVKYKENSYTNSVYQLILNNGNKRLKVKINESGEFLN